MFKAYGITCNDKLAANMESQPYIAPHDQEGYDALYIELQHLKASYPDDEFKLIAIGEFQ